MCEIFWGAEYQHFRVEAPPPKKGPPGNPGIVKIFDLLPSRQKTLNQCWFNIGPASETVDQH